MNAVRRWWRVSSAVAVGLALACACGDGPIDPDGGVDGGELIAVDVETIAPETVMAGQPIAPSCLLIDEMGESFFPPTELERTYRIVPGSSVMPQDDGSFLAIVAGEVEVACEFPSLRLTDDTPAIVEILPGSPARVVTTLERDSLEAGEDVRVGCEVYDAYGNQVEGTTPTYRSEPADEINTFEANLGTFQRAGSFDVYCDLPGAESTPAGLEVRPGLPASLVIARVPDRSVYAIGEVIDIRRIVSDRFDNPVEDALVPVRSVPNGQQLGDGRFRYLADGRYELTATVTPPTHDDIPLSASTIVIVDQNGPAISCDDPIDGAILNRAPGGGLTFRGSVADISGVSEVRVNGAVVPVDASGEFSASLATEWGINFIDIAAVDTTGREASRTCAFLVSDVWAPDYRTTNDMLSLTLRQQAVDDSSRAGDLDSLGDVLYTVLNSSGLRNSLHSSLLAGNPLKPNSCDERVLGICVLRSEVIYQDMSVPGPNTVSLTLVDGGLRASIRVDNLAARIRVRGHVAGIPYDTSGWVTFDYVDVNATFDARISAGRPLITVRPGSVSTNVGGISTSFGGLDGAIINIVVSLFNGTVRNLISGLVTGWVTDNLNDVLDDVVGGLDVSTLGTSFDVPRLDSSETIPLSFSLGFSNLNSNPSRMVFGLATRFFAPPAHARPTFGAPVRAGTRLLAPTGPGSTAVAVHESLLNQATHALWRGGFFDATIGSSSLGGGLPDGMEAELFTGLPPVAQVVSSDRVELALGSVSVRLAYPDLFATPINVTLGARATLAAHLVGDDMVFDGFMIDELFFSTDIASLDMATRDIIEGFFTRLLERVLSEALNDALPAIPIPSFELPASLATYGLPAGAELGIVSPSLALESPHFVLRGNFAVR